MIGVSTASICSRRSSRNGGRISFSPRWAGSSSTPKPGSRWRARTGRRSARGSRSSGTRTVDHRRRPRPVPDRPARARPRGPRTPSSRRCGARSRPLDPGSAGAGSYAQMPPRLGPRTSQPSSTGSNSSVLQQVAAAVGVRGVGAHVVEALERQLRRTSGWSAIRGWSSTSATTSACSRPSGSANAGRRRVRDLPSLAARGAPPRSRAPRRTRRASRSGGSSRAGAADPRAAELEERHVGARAPSSSA